MTLLTTKRCPRCVTVKNMLVGTDVNILDAEDNLDICIENNIRVVPALIDGSLVLRDFDEIVAYVKAHTGA